MNHHTTRPAGRATLTRAGFGVLAAGLIASAAYGFVGPAQAAPPPGHTPATIAAVDMGGGSVHLDWPDLQRGSRGLNVQALQLVLTERGYPTRVDGRYGAHTASRVAAFQKANRLRPTGVMSDRTFERLLPIVSRGARGQEVRAVQRLLNRTGHRVREDGVFGPRTRAAVHTFQYNAVLCPDGVVGRQTWFILMQPDFHSDGC